jgi:two-component system, NarL family, sensor histidine kinase YdfH
MITMKILPALIQHLKFNRNKKVPSEQVMEWPFFIILTFAFVFIYFQSIFSNHDLREPWRLILFTVLMSVHTILHWFSVRLKKWDRVAIYLLVQCGLAFTVVYLSGSVASLLAIYMGLIGETIGLLGEKPRWRIAVGTGLLGLSFVNYLFLADRGKWYWWFVAMAPLTVFVVVYVILYSRQAEARARAQALARDLETANRQLSEYASRVEDLTIAAERQRMARELHDTLSQGLAGLILQLEAADAYLAGSRTERAREILKQSMDKARGTLAEARLAIDDLRRPAERDLVEAVQRETDHFTIATGITCAPQIEVTGIVPDPIAETAVRVISEGLTNIARHARARNVTLRLIGSKNGLEIEICDDGIGFEPDAVEAGHYGLLGMRERLRLAGGSLQVHSTPGKGTCILIHIPLEEPIHG